MGSMMTVLFPVLFDRFCLFSLSLSLPNMWTVMTDLEFLSECSGATKNARSLEHGRACSDGSGSSVWMKIKLKLWGFVLIMVVTDFEWLVLELHVNYLRQMVENMLVGFVILCFAPFSIAVFQRELVARFLFFRLHIVPKAIQFQNLCGTPVSHVMLQNFE